MKNNPYTSPIAVYIFSWTSLLPSNENALRCSCRKENYVKYISSILYIVQSTWVGT